MSRAYIAPNGEYEIIGYTRQPTWSGDRWCNDFSIKNRNNIEKYIITAWKTFPKKKIIKEIKRNGFKSNLHKLAPFNLFKAILTNPHAETLLKTQQISLLDHALEHWGFKKVEKYWNSIKICIRNNYIVRDAGDYMDHLQILEKLGKDLRSPKYICPENFNKEHARYVQKDRAFEQKKRLAEKRAEIAESQIQYVKDKEKFFKLEFERKDITIKVLDSVKDIMYVGDVLKHCIFSSAYYKRKASLLLCAYKGTEPLETIEFSLKDFKIKQSRGLGNKPSKHHDEIVSLMEDNSIKVKRILKPKKKRKPKAKLVA